MKNTILKLTLVISCAFLIGACKKEESELLLSEGNLTDCKNGKCTYLFTESADFTFLPMKITPGNSRVFQFFKKYIIDNPIMTEVYIEAPMTGTEFTLNKKDVLNGAVGIEQGCPVCTMIPLKLVNGYVLGKNLTPNKPADQAKWLIEARLIRETEFYPSIKDTLYIKQYFYPNFVYN